ncbi:MAG: flagellar motor protein MotB [Pseudomonadales bacterium]
MELPGPNNNDALRARLQLAAEGANDDDQRNRWMVSYADFMTLLFAFFVVMYAISSVNTEKYQVLSSTLEQVFAQPRSVDELQIGDPTLAASPHVIDMSTEAGYADPEEGDTELRSDSEPLEQSLSGFIDNGAIEIESNKDWLEVSLNGTFSFAPGSANLTTTGLEALAVIGEFLNGFSEPITVEGYTDNVPMVSSRFSSNWMLSSARAAAVAGNLQSLGVDRDRLSAVGYGENHFIRSNATPAGRSENRRVVIVVARHGNLARNLNAAAGGAAFAFVRREPDHSNRPAIDQRRTAAGGLIFSGSPES